MEQRQEVSQGESQTPKQPTESEELEQDQHLTKKLQVTTKIIEEKKMPEKTLPLMNITI